MQGALGDIINSSNIPKSFKSYFLGSYGPVLDAEGTALSKSDGFSLLPRSLHPIGGCRECRPEPLDK